MNASARVTTIGADDFALREFFAICAGIERRLRNVNPAVTTTIITAAPAQTTQRTGKRGRPRKTARAGEVA